MPPRLLLLATLVVALAATPGEARTTRAEQPLKVALVTTLVGLTDRGLVNAVYLGLRQAVEELGVDGRVLTPTPREENEPALAHLGRQGYDAVFVAVFQSDDVERVAPQFPRTSFVLPDFPLSEVRHPAGNVRSLVFRAEEAAYLAGYLAGSMERRRPGRDVVSVVGGAAVPGVEPFVAGFRAGARRAAPGISVLIGYADHFLDTRKCAAIARSQIARGSGVVFQVADRCGLGALAVARRNGVWGVGVDVDQAYLGRHILTSVLKRYDVAVFDTIRGLQDGSLPLGGTSVFTLANGGVGLGRISGRVPGDLVAAVERVRRQIVAGRIDVPSTLS